MVGKREAGSEVKSEGKKSGKCPEMLLEGESGLSLTGEAGEAGAPWEGAAGKDCAQKEGTR